MIRRIYLDLIRDKILKKDVSWVLKRALQYLLIHASFSMGRPLCGPILGTVVSTYRCNYHCKMCDLPLINDELQKQGLKELSTLQLKQLLRDFAALGISGIGFTGGEPFLRTDIFELLRYAKELRMFTHINTNGFFLNNENTRELSCSGVDSINISLDGARAETHDTIRGYQGAFDKAISAIENINVMRRKTKIPIRLKVVTVMNELNIDEIPDLVMLSEELKTDSIEFIPQQPFFASCKSVSSYADDIFLEKVSRVINCLIEFKEKRIKIENSFRGLKLFLMSFKGEKSPVICYAGYNSYTVDCYGQIFPCLPWVNWRKPLSNIKDNSLQEFWYSASYNKLRHNIIKCRSCYLNCQTELNLLFNALRS
jgi:MoaA/NifB/PqqE/SkfB family radical SAM enzyme